MLFEASSVNTKEPSLATVTPTGRLNNLASSQHEAGDESQAYTSGFPVRRIKSNDFVTGPVSAVPGTMRRGEYVAAIFGGELFAVIKR